MKEKDLQSMFRNWLRANWTKSSAFELKICKEDKLSFSKIESHQISNLKMVKDGLFFYKIPDLGVQNPFDCFTLHKEDAYVVIFFYKPRQPKKFYMIDINSIIGLCDDGHKSIDEKMAMVICEVKGELK